MPAREVGLGDRPRRVGEGAQRREDAPGHDPGQRRRRAAGRARATPPATRMSLVDLRLLGSEVGGDDERAAPPAVDARPAPRGSAPASGTSRPRPGAVRARRRAARSSAARRRSSRVADARAVGRGAEEGEDRLALRRDVALQERRRRSPARRRRTARRCAGRARRRPGAGTPRPPGRGAVDALAGARPQDLALDDDRHDLGDDQQHDDPGQDPDPRARQEANRRPLRRCPCRSSRRRRLGPCHDRGPARVVVVGLDRRAGVPAVVVIVVGRSGARGGRRGSRGGRRRPRWSSSAWSSCAASPRPGR